MPAYFIPWYAAPVIGFAAAYRLSHSRCNLLTISVFFTAFRFAAQILMHMIGASAAGDFDIFYEVSLPLAAFTNCLTGVAIFWELAAKFPGFRVAGSWLLFALAALSGLAAWSTAGIGGLPFGSYPVWLSVSGVLFRHGMTIAGLTVCMGRIVLTRDRGSLPVSDWAIRAADSFGIYALVSAAAMVFTEAHGINYPILIGILPPLNFCGFAAACLFWLPRAAEACADVLPVGEQEASRLLRTDPLPDVRALYACIRRYLTQ